MGCARGRRVRWPRQLKAIVSLELRLLFSFFGLRTQTPACSDPWPAAAVCVLLPEIACAPLFPRVQGGMRGFLHVSRPQLFWLRRPVRPDSGALGTLRTLALLTWVGVRPGRSVFGNSVCPSGPAGSPWHTRHSEFSGFQTSF